MIANNLQSKLTSTIGSASWLAGILFSAHVTGLKMSYRAQTVLTVKDFSSRPLWLLESGTLSSVCPLFRSLHLDCSASLWRTPSSHPTSPTARSELCPLCPSPHRSPADGTQGGLTEEHMMTREASQRLFWLYSPSWPHLWRSSCKEQTSGDSGLQWCDSLRLSLQTRREIESKFERNQCKGII